MGIQFDGTDDSAQTGAAYGSNNIVSISFWIYWPSTDAPQDYQYAFMMQESVLAYFFSTGGTAHKLLLQVRSGAAWRLLTDFQISTNAWHHYCMTNDSANSPYHSYGYVDGTQRGSYDGIRENISNRIVSIGDNLNAGANGALKMAELAIWEGYVLSSQDITDLQTLEPDNLQSGTTSSSKLTLYAPMVDSIGLDVGSSAFSEDAGSGITMLGTSDHPITVASRPTGVAYDWSLVIS